MLRQLFELHDRGAGIDPPALRDAFDGRDYRLGAGVDDDVFAADLLRPLGGFHGDGFRGGETAFARVDVDTGVVGQLVVILVPQQVDQRRFRGDGLPVIIPPLPEGKRMPCGCEPGAVDQGFGRYAADVDTGSPVHFVRAFDHRDAPIVCGQFGGEGLARFAEADDDGIILFHNFPCFKFPGGMWPSPAHCSRNANIGVLCRRGNGRTAGCVGNNSRSRVAGRYSPAGDSNRSRAVSLYLREISISCPPTLTRRGGIRRRCWPAVSRCFLSRSCTEC